MQNNYDDVKRLLPYHEQMDEALDSLILRVFEQGGTVTVTEFMQALPSGFKVPILETYAWEVANRTGAINHIDFDLAMDLGKLYGWQAFLQGKLDVSGQNWYVAGNINPENFTATTVAISALTNDIVIQEKRLMEIYPGMIERLENVRP